MKSTLVVICLFLYTFSIAQKDKIGRFDNTLSEISGHCFYNDSILIGINDSENEPILFFFNKQGKTIHQVKIENALNIDWEDLVYDTLNQIIFIADIGNNNNNRKDLCLYKIHAENLLNYQSIEAEKIEFSYPNQNAFPPINEQLHFDAEAIFLKNDSLFILTKCRAVPFDGKAFCYYIPQDSGKHIAELISEVYIGTTGWWRDSITSSYYWNDKLYILTYDRILVYYFEKNSFNFVEEKRLRPITQKEGICIDKKGNIFISEERQKHIGKGNLYWIKWKI